MAHVVVAEDDATVRAALRRVLEHHAHEVHEARNGWEALRILRTSSSPMVVLTGIAMSHCSGIDMLRAVLADDHLRRHHRYLLMAAQHLSAWLPTDVAELLAAPIVAKPVAMRTLLDVVALVNATIPADQHTGSYR